jgi:isochorismate synthase
VSQLRARRETHGELSDADRAALRRAAARVGVLHATEELVIVAFGTAASVELPGGLADPAAPRRVAAALGDVTLDGDPGPAGTGVAALGALPFERTAPARLSVPRCLAAWRPGAEDAWVTTVGERDDDVLALHLSAGGPVAARGEVVSLEERPSRDDYATAVARCVARIGHGDLDKVVLARAAVGQARTTFDPAGVAEALHALDPSCCTYAVPDAHGRFVGASPELLVATADGAVAAHPLGGTVPMRGDGGDDERLAWLVADAKNRQEHAAVVDDVVARLSPYCEAIHAAPAPSAVRLSTNARLGTWVDGKLARPLDVAVAVELLAALHPTPAVGGVPRDEALAVIAELEAAPRGLWAGAVGWVDADGASTWTLSLRGVRLDGAAFEAWGGAGIVAASVPDEEADETGEKLASVLRVLGA